MREKKFILRNSQFIPSAAIRTTEIRENCRTGRDGSLFWSQADLLTILGKRLRPESTNTNPMARGKARRRHCIRDSLPPIQWLKAPVATVFPGQDDKVCVAQVKIVKLKFWEINKHLIVWKPLKTNDINFIPTYLSDYAKYFY